MCPNKTNNNNAAAMDMKEQYKRVFRHLDSDGDGKLSPAELRRCVAGTPHEMSEEEAEELVRAADGDGDGLLGLEEFLKVMEGSGEEEEDDVEEREIGLREAFKMYEMEGSGCITPRSLKRMLSRLGDKRSAGECEAMISVFDIDGDGVLSFEEFKVMMS